MVAPDAWFSCHPCRLAGTPRRVVRATLSGMFNPSQDEVRRYNVMNIEGAP